MHVEVSVALNFVISYLYNKLPRRRVDMFGHELEKRMKVKFDGHWYPDKPTKGSAYRCIRVNGEKVDSDIEKAAFESGLDISEIKSYLPADLTLWIDPSEVSYRIAEKGSIKILYSDKRDDDTVDNIDCEVQAVSKSFNPEAQCFKPIDSLSSSLSSLSLSPSSPTSPAGWSNTTSPSGALFNSSTMAGAASVSAGNQNHVTAASSNTSSSSSSAQSSGIINTVVAVPVPTTGAGASSALLAPSHSSTGGVTHNSNVAAATPTPGTSATSPTVSSSAVNASNSAAPTPGPGSTAPVVVAQSNSFLNKPSHTSPQFTASTFAQTKFGSTKLKSQVKRPTRLSPIEFRNYFRQRTAGSSLQSSPVTPTGGSLIGAGNAVPVSAVPSTVGNPAVRVGVGYGHSTTVVNTVPSPSAAGARPRSLSPRDPRLEFIFEHQHHHTHHRYIPTINGHQKPLIGTNTSLLPQQNAQQNPQSQQQLPQSFLHAQQQIPSPQAQQQQQQQQQQAPLPSPSSTGMTLRDFYQSNQGPASPFNASGPVPTAAAPTNITFTDFLPNAMSNQNIQSDSQKTFIGALSNLGTTAYNNQFHHLLVAN